MGNLKSFFGKCKRVWKIMKKPSNSEFKNIAKVAAIGILALGFLGFVIAVLMSFVK